MKKIILYRNGESLMGTDQLMNINGRYNLDSIVRCVEERNARFAKNFPNKVADGFRFCDARLNEYGGIIEI